MGGREGNGLLVTAQTPCPRPDLQPAVGAALGCAWKPGSVSGLKCYCLPRQFPSPGNLGIPRARQKGELKATAKGHAGFPGLIQPQVTMALSQVQQTIVCALLFRPSITHPKMVPPQHTHSPPDIRKKHVRMGGPRSHPLPLPFQAEGNRTGGMGSPTVGRGGSQQAGSRRGRCTLTTRPLVESGTLSATDIRPAQASHLWSKEESRGHELRVECSAFRTEGEKCKSLVAGSHLLHPCMWVVSSAPSICQRGQTGPSPEERRQSR